MERCKSLVKIFERTLAHATRKTNLCFVRLMVKKLAAIASAHSRSQMTPISPYNNPNIFYSISGIVRSAVLAIS